MEILGILCTHKHQTTPRRDVEGEYRRCLDCGGRLAWAWPDDFPIRPPRSMERHVSSAQSWAATLAWEASRKSA